MILEKQTPGLQPSGKNDTPTLIIIPFATIMDILLEKNKYCAVYLFRQFTASKILQQRDSFYARIYSRVSSLATIILGQIYVDTSSLESTLTWVVL